MLHHEHVILHKTAPRIRSGFLDWVLVYLVRYTTPTISSVPLMLQNEGCFNLHKTAPPDLARL
jgi:hypothetical protein